MQRDCDVESLTEPSHVAIGGALCRCLHETLREPEHFDRKIDFELDRLTAMIERWAQRGLDESVDHLDPCLELISASSRTPESSMKILASFEGWTNQDYIVALTAVVRLLAKPTNDLEELSRFVSSHCWERECAMCECISNLTSLTHDYATFNAKRKAEWRFAVDEFEYVTRPAAALVQWLINVPPREFEEPMI